MVKIPKKNRKKMKPCDPFNPNKNQIDEQNAAKHNFAPTAINEEQNVPRAILEMQQAQKWMEERERKGTMPKKKDKLKEALATVGIERKPRESVKNALGRMQDKVNKEIGEIKLKVSMGTAGRAADEIKKEYKEMDEEERKKREEKLLKRKAAEEKKYGQARDKTIKRLEALQGKGDKKTKLATKKERMKEKQKEEREADQKEAVLNAREVVEFGERYDAPPVFEGAFKQKIKPLMAKAGGKGLLLHDLLKKPGQSSVFTPMETSVENEETPVKKKEKMSKLMEEERKRVIEAYRQMKKGKGRGTQVL